MTIDNLKENPLHFFTSAVRVLTAWANQGAAEEEKPRFNWGMFSLDNLAACFQGVDKNNFLTEKPIDSYLSDLDPSEFSLRGLIPEGTRITLMAAPCDINGLPFEQSLFNDNTNTIHPYFQVLFSNPQNNSGMALGWEGGLKAAPYLKIIPEEILLQCSFVVEYMAGKDGERFDGESDHHYFNRMMRAKYARLCELLKGRM